MFKKGDKIRLIKNDYEGASNYSQNQGLVLGKIYTFKMTSSNIKYISIKERVGTFTENCFELVERVKIEPKIYGISKFMDKLNGKI